jgi:hypothetical protein
MFNVAVNGPVFRGLKTTLIVHCPPGSTMVQLFVWLKGGLASPPIAIPVTVKGLWPLLRTVTGTLLLCAPTTTAGKGT